MKKILAGLLALLIVLASLPVLSLSAAVEHVNIPENAETVEIDGTTFKVIDSVDDFDELGGTETANQHVILAKDIDFGGKVYSSKPYKLQDSIFEGNGYCLYNFSLEKEGNFNIGLFDFGGSSTIQNLVIGTPENPIEALCDAPDLGEKRSVGIVLGYSNATHYLKNITVYGNVKATNCHAGGFAGSVKGAITIENCHYIGTVKRVGGDADQAGIGGLVGMPWGSGTFNVTNCSFSGEVAVDNAVTGSTYAGGIFGYSRRSGASIQNSISYGKVTSNSYSGGIVGGSTEAVAVTNCAVLGSVAGTTAGLLAGNFASTATANGVYAFNGVELPVVGSGTGAVTNAYTLLASTDATQKTAAEAAALLNEKLGALSDFIQSTDGKSVCIATPRLAGIQESDIAEDAFDIRLLGAIGNSLVYKEVGFRIVANGIDLDAVHCTKVYNTVLAAGENGELEEVTAESLDATYLYALTITGVPAVGEVTLVVTPYAVAPDGATVYTDASYTITYINGVFDNICEN